MSAEDCRRGKQLLAEGHVPEAIDHFGRASRLAAALARDIIWRAA